MTVMGNDVPCPASVMALASIENWPSCAFNWLIAALMAFWRRFASPRISVRATPTRRAMASSPDLMPCEYELTAPINVNNDVTLRADHGDVLDDVASVRVVGAPFVPTSEELNDGVSDASRLKGSLRSPLSRSATKVVDADPMACSMTTVRLAGALGFSKCKKASDANVRAVRRPGSMDVSPTRFDRGVSTLSAVSEPAPSTCKGAAQASVLE